MNYQSQLAQYRDMFAQREAAKVASQSEAEPEQRVMWEDELEMMQPMLSQMDPALVAQELEDVQVMQDRDSRFTGDATADQQAYQDYLMNDPDFQEHSPAMEEILAEVIERAKDPNDPLTAEEAQQLFAQKMEEQFGSYFQ